MDRRLPLVLTGVLALALASASFAYAAAAPSFSGESTKTAKPSGQRAPSAPSHSSQQEASVSATTTSKPAAERPKSLAPKGTEPYSMDFTLPTLGKSGCMVCHGDRNLIRIKGNEYVSYYVPEGVIEASVHGPGEKTGRSGVLCTACHLDFASTTKHKDADWRRTAKQACRACHTSQDDAFGKGAHAADNRPGQVDEKADEKPLCGDCHGDHEIMRLDDKGDAALHRNGWQVCGRCHENEWDSYTDYYHGAAYRRGALDAPACWDCHGAHDVLPSSDRRSLTHSDNLVDTCGTCHDGADEAFVSYTGLVHRGAAARQENPLYGFIQRTQTGISEALSNIADAVRSWFI